MPMSFFFLISCVSKRKKLDQKEVRLAQQSIMLVCVNCTKGISTTMWHKFIFKSLIFLYILKVFLKKVNFFYFKLIFVDIFKYQNKKIIF